jgi:energy-coupling factor transporter transmembrane protein EcfT
MTRRPGLFLAASLVAIIAAALTPVGLSGHAIPPWAWVVWLAAMSGALALFRRAGFTSMDAVRRTSWLLPVVAVFVGPAAWLAPPGTRGMVALALLARAWSAASLGAGLATCLGPSGLARGVRQLGVPVRLADVFESTLASLSIVLRQVRAMLRAREARRPGFGAWSAVLVTPVDTLRGFGRLVAALLLRSLERAEAIEQARRARGGGA